MCERTHYADRANRFTVFSLAPYRRVQRLHGYIADLIAFSCKRRLLRWLQ
jgi:hypothetical protein